MIKRLAVVILVLGAACARDEAPAHLVLATTTSVGNSGLLDTLAPRFQAETGVEIRPALAGSGRALRSLERGEADVVISHAPETETEVLGRHPGWRYRKIMFNDFVVAGPLADSAAVASATSLEEALGRIVRSGAAFVSRGDQSGTHERERALWKLAGVAPAPDRLLTSGAGMAITLRQASDRDAYTLTDRATFEQVKPQLKLKLVWEGDPRLLNTYAVIVDPAGPRHADAQRFADWLATGHGRELIAAYRIKGSDARPFDVWPEAAPRETPSALPR